MRVIGGEHRGRNLQAPDNRHTRPTSDRVREAIFDMLGSIFGPDGLHGRAVLDLFAGSGALGIEALSRGASQATFVEQDPGAVTTIRANLAALGIDEARATVHRGDVDAWLDGAGGRAWFDVVLCDPPYASDRWATLWSRLQAQLVVAESGEELVVPEPWYVHRRKHYGSTLVTVVTSDGGTAAVATSGRSTGGRAAIATGMEAIVTGMETIVTGMERGVR